MSSRREFLKDFSRATAGIVFTGCGLVDSALALMQNQQQSATPRGKRREVVIGGRRVTTIDVHCHIQVLEIWDVIRDYPVPPFLVQQQARYLQKRLGSEGSTRNVDQRLADMDQMGIDVQAVSVMANYYWAEPEMARQIIQIQNETIAELCAAHPDRFVGLGGVALKYPDLAVEQLEEGVKKLGLRGCLIGGSVEGEELSSPKFYPFWAKAEQLGALVFMHPQTDPDPVLGVRPRLQGNGFLVNVIGHPLETTIALSHLIQEGVLDRFPDLKICGAHGGGYLPSYANRNDACLIAWSEYCKPLKKLPSEYLKQLYYDSIVFTPEDARHLIAKVGVSQVVLGTDYPTLWNRNAVDLILDVPGLSNAERTAILGGTLAKLLRISS